MSTTAKLILAAVIYYLWKNSQTPVQQWTQPTVALNPPTKLIPSPVDVWTPPQPPQPCPPGTYLATGDAFPGQCLAANLPSYAYPGGPLLTPGNQQITVSGPGQIVYYSQ